MEETHPKHNNIYIRFNPKVMNHLEMNMRTRNIVLIQLQKRNYRKSTQI